MPGAIETQRAGRSLSIAVVPLARGTLLAFALLLTSCGPGGHEPAVGADDTVTLVAGEGVPEPAPALLERTLSEEIRYVRAEPLFRVERVPPSRLEDSKGRKSIVLLANLNVPGRAARAAREILTEEQLSNAASHHGVIAPLEDVWGSGQTVVVLASTTPEGTLALVEERFDRIREVMISTTKDRLARALYKEGENPAEAKRLASEQGWSLRLPSRGWEVDTARASERVVRVRASNPARSLSVCWIPADSLPLEPASALDLRDTFAARFGDHAAIARDAAAVTEGRFLGQRALYIRGALKVEGAAHESALQSILFVEPSRERLYLVDGVVSAPPSEMKLWMWQLEALANTFRPAS
jgi:uncharacterized protein DUF4837